MRTRVASFVNSALAKAGYQLRKSPRSDVRPVPRENDDRPLPQDMEPDILQIIRQVRPFTMTSPERIYGLVKAVDYICQNTIDGDIVECGVWRGGSSIAVAQRLCEIGDTQRHLWLYDTFAGMPAPSEVDVSRNGASAITRFEELSDGGDYSDWCRASLAEVEANMARTSYPPKNVHFVEGKVEETVPEHMPDTIALLRLDTDWYSSTKHELHHLYPRLAQGGVLIIDDYGHWAGCRRAVDEYLLNVKPTPLLSRIDYAGRICIKP